MFYTDEFVTEMVNDRAKKKEFFTRLNCTWKREEEFIIAEARLGLWPFDRLVDRLRRTPYEINTRLMKLNISEDDIPQDWKDGIALWKAALKEKSRYDNKYYKTLGQKSPEDGRIPKYISPEAAIAEINKNGYRARYDKRRQQYFLDGSPVPIQRIMVESGLLAVVPNDYQGSY